MTQTSPFPGAAAMTLWVPVETGQPQDLRRFVSREETLGSNDPWRGFRFIQVMTSPGSLPEGSLQQQMVYLHLGEPAVLERYAAGERWHTVTLKAGSLLVAPAGAPVAARWQRPLSGLDCYFESEFMARALGGRRVELTFAHADADPLVAQILFALREDVREGLPQGRMYGETLATALAVHLARFYSAEKGFRPAPRGTLPPNRLRRVLEYINDQLEADLSLADLANVVGLNPDYFARAFKRTTRVSPYRYVLLQRIDRACALLRDPRVSIAEITARSGFACQSSFTTAFRRIKGITPSAYRRGLPFG